jgi:2,4-dienoyl-CoA reductase-like NADH-dependent reductase (Old Yellow Enzyme family)
MTINKLNQKKLFKKTVIGGIELNNAIVRSATATFMSDEKGYVTSEVKQVYKDLSEGEIGLIVFEDTGVGKVTLEPKHLMIGNDSYIDGYKDIVDQIHFTGGKTIMQLSHSGILRKDENMVDVSDGFSEHLISKEDISEIIGLFGNAAVRAQKAGFDGVQIHAAHGYFLSKFLSPFFNRRNDEYGGSIENRTRIVVEILNDIKNKCGADYPVFLKINSSDFMKEENTNTLTEAKQIAVFLDKAGIDAIEVSGGVENGEYSCVREKILKPEQEAYHLENALQIAREVSTSVIVVGGMRSPEVINRVLEDNQDIKGVAIARPLISEPHLVKRWKEGNIAKARCISCNKCFNLNGATCIFNKRKKA